jgi:hypothetical protein
MKAANLKNDAMNSAVPRPRRIVTAPSPTHPSLHSTVLDVECAENEEVEWIWTATAAGRFISGYQLRPARDAT